MNTSFRDALLLAQETILQKDPSSFIFGLDVDDHRGIFGSTLGLKQKFPDRVFATQLSEEGMTGVAIGAALNGMHPIHIHIRADFLILALNQLLNMASNIRYVSGGQLNVPLVIRSVIGRGWGQGAQHSKALHSVLAHVPGLKVLMPATVQDAYSCLLKAHEDPDPVIIFEHRWLYDVLGPLNLKDIPNLNEPQILREGTDVSIIATSWMVIEAHHAAEFLSEQGISVEVINLRSIRPIDQAKLFKSASKTGRVVIADYDWCFAGLSAELSASISENCFGKLKAPIKRIGFAESPCPTVRHLEDVYYPSAEHIIRACEQLMGKSPAPMSGLKRNSWEDRFKGPF